MSEPKTQPTQASVDAFLAHQPEDRRKDCLAIAAMMRKATGEEATLWGPSIVGFGRYAYTNTTKKTYEWPLVGFSPRKNDLTLYIMPGFDQYENLLAKLGKHKIGKSCLYIKRLADVDTKVLEELVQASVEAMAPRRVR